MAELLTRDPSSKKMISPQFLNMQFNMEAKKPDFADEIIQIYNEKYNRV